MVSVGPVLLKYFDKQLKPLSDETARFYLNKLKHGDESARNVLFEGCVRLATVMARKYNSKYYGNALDFDDFLQESYTVIWKRIHKWDTNYPIKTWVGLLLKSHLNLLIRHNSGVMVLPRSFWQKVRALDKLTLDYDSDLTRTEQLELLFQPFGKLGDVLNDPRTSKTESIYSQFDDCAVKEISQNNRLTIDSNTYCIADVERLLRICVKDNKRRELFARRYGLCKKRQHTLSELQQLYDMTYKEAQYQISLALKEMHEYVYPLNRERKCECCGAVFEPDVRHPNARTCSRKCGKELEKQNYQTKKRKRQCACCGSMFLARNDQVFCSRKCNKRAAYRRKQGKPVSDEEYARAN